MMGSQDGGERSERPEHDSEGKKFAEKVLKRLFEAGVVKLTEGPENLRNFVGEMRVPKEIANYLFAQIDETKNGLYRVVAREIRDFLEHTNLAEEMTSALTRLSFEIRTEIRFVPNDSAMPRPEVNSEVRVTERPPNKTLKTSPKTERTRKKTKP